MAKYAFYSFSYLDWVFEADSMKDCVRDSYRVFQPAVDEEHFEQFWIRDENLWKDYFIRNNHIVEFEVEGG